VWAKYNSGTEIYFLKTTKWVVDFNSLSQFYECNVLTYLLTVWGKVLLEKLTGFQLVKKFPSL
jgi:hypothetical protein